MQINSLCTFCKPRNLRITSANRVSRRRRSGCGRSFYRDRLGHRMLWRSDEAVGLALRDTYAELAGRLDIGPETDVLVEDVDEAFAFFLSAGGEVVQRPFEIAIGRCARVRDPFGNELTLLDQSKGTLATDRDGRLIGVRPGRSPGQRG